METAVWGRWVEAVREVCIWLDYVIECLHDRLRYCRMIWLLIWSWAQHDLSLILISVWFVFRMQWHSRRNNRLLSYYDITRVGSFLRSEMIHNMLYQPIQQYRISASIIDPHVLIFIEHRLQWHLLLVTDSRETRLVVILHRNQRSNTAIFPLSRWRHRYGCWRYRRRLYHVVSFVMFIANVPVGVFAILKRVLLSLFFGVIRLGRLDHILIMRGFERFDTGLCSRTLVHTHTRYETERWI